MRVSRLFRLTRFVKEAKMRTDDFDYNLPEELIAQAPAEPRDSCRLLVVDRKGSEAGTPLEHGGTVEHRIFRDIIDYIEPGDVLVIKIGRAHV